MYATDSRLINSERRAPAAGRLDGLLPTQSPTLHSISRRKANLHQRRHAAADRDESLMQHSLNPELTPFQRMHPDASTGTYKFLQTTSKNRYTHSEDDPMASYAADPQRH